VDNERNRQKWASAQQMKGMPVKAFGFKPEATERREGLKFSDRI